MSFAPTLPMISTTAATDAPPPVEKSRTVGIFFGLGRKVPIEKAAIFIACTGLIYSTIEAVLPLIVNGIWVPLYELPDLAVYTLLLVGLLKRRLFLIKLFLVVFAIDRLLVLFWLNPEEYANFFSPILFSRVQTYAHYGIGMNKEYVDYILFISGTIYGLSTSLMTVFSFYCLWITYRVYKLMLKQGTSNNSMGISSPFTITVNDDEGGGLETV